MFKCDARICSVCSLVVFEESHCHEMTGTVESYVEVFGGFDCECCPKYATCPLTQVDMFTHGDDIGF